MTVRVTARDIKLAQKWDKTKDYRSFTCPVARALQRTLKDKTIHCYSSEFWSKHIKKEIVLPASVRDFIAAFDEGEKVKPFSFKIARPK